MAVLPFRSADTRVGSEIGLGMAVEVSAALSHLQAPYTIATATFWDSGAPAVDALKRCRAYQLDYVIDGVIAVQDNQIRLKVTLLDVVLDFEVIWTRQFDGQLSDLLDLQNRIVSEAIAQIDPDLLECEPSLQWPAKTRNAAAHRLVLTAMRGIFGLDRREFMSAREHLAQATVLDPAYAAAHAWQAYWGIMAVGQGWAEDPREVTALAGAAAGRAMALDPLDARALAIAGHVRAYLVHDVPSALKLHARAIKLNPNLPIAWTMSSWSRIYNGEHAAAVRHAMMSQSLSPNDPHIFFVEHAMMTARFFSRQLEEAEMLAEVVLEKNPGHASALNVRLAILGHMARLNDANHCLETLQKIDPNVSVEKIVARAPLRPADKAFYIDGLLRAGVPRRQTPG